MDGYANAEDIWSKRTIWDREIARAVYGFTNAKNIQMENYGETVSSWCRQLRYVKYASSNQIPKVVVRNKWDVIDLTLKKNDIF